MNKYKRSKKIISDWEPEGSITIYISLVLILVLVLICTLIESGRINAMNARLSGVTYMGMDSVFSEYAEPVFEDYGVMMLWCTDSEFIKRFEGYTAKNLSNTGITLRMPADLYKNEHISTELETVKRAVDDGGDLFAEQVYEYMKYFLAENFAEELLSDSKIFDEADNVNKFTEKIKKHRKTFLAVEKSAEKLKKKIDKMQSSARDPARLLEKILKAAEGYDEKNATEAADSIYRGCDELQATKNSLSGSLTDLKEATSDYHEKVDKAQDAVTQIESELSVDRADYSEEVYTELKNEIDEIRTKSGETEADFYNAEKNEQVIDEHIGKLDSLNGIIAEINSGVSENNVGSIQAMARGLIGEFDDFDMNRLEIFYDKDKVKKEDSGFLDSIQEIFDRGVMGYIAPEISKKAVETSGLPSEESNESGKREGIAKAALNKAVYSEYVMKHFTCYTGEKKDNALDYEIEYILSGRSSDRGNLEKVVNELIALRTGCNMVSLIGDAQKKGEAMALATAIVGFTGMPVLVKITQLVILGIWALAEAITDVKALLNGEKIPAIKRSDEWTLSLNGMKEFAVSSIDNKKLERGLKYEEYLRVLLLAQNSKTQIMRSMDIIELNMKKNENSSFKISGCIVDATVNATYTSPQLFTTFPFVRRYLGCENGKYIFEIRQRYLY